LPVAEPLRPEDFLAVRMLADPQISPDGTLVAFTVIDQDRAANQLRSAIWIAPSDGSAAPRRLTHGPRRDQRPRFSTDGTHLAFLSNREFEWRPDLYVLDLAGGEAARVARLPRGILEFEWSPDGRRFALLGRPEWPVDPDLPKHTDDDETRKRYQERMRHLVRRFRYQMDGIGQLDDEEPQIWVVDGAGENAGLRQVTDGPWPAAQPRWTPDGRIAYLANRDEDWWRSDVVDIWVVDSEGGDPQRLTSGGAWVTSFGFAGNGTLAYVAGVAGLGTRYARHLHLFIGGVDRTAGLDRSVWAGVGPSDTAPPRETPDLYWAEEADAVYTPMTNGGRIGVVRYESAGGAFKPVLSGDRVILAYSLAAGKVAFLSTSFDDPLTLRTAKVDGTDEHVVYEPNPWLRERALGQVRVMNFEHAGRTIDAWAMLPPGYQGGRIPTLLNIHGGPHFAFGWNFSVITQTMAGQGYAVLACNSPGSQTYDEEYSLSLTGRWGELDFPVWMALVDKAVLEGIADPERLGVMGASYGGFATLWVIGHTDRFRAAVAINPVSNLESMYGSSDIGWIFETGSIGAEPWENPELYRRLSPLTYAERMTTPLLISSSSGDLRTPLEQAQQVYARLLKLGREVELIVFHGEPHGMSIAGKPWNRVRRMRAMLEWWKRHLSVPAADTAGLEPSIAT
jgi:dipeptidyl aminopeptidase/acylaminoacyl peptidase